MPLYSTKLLLKAAWLSASSSHTQYGCWLLGDRCSMFQHQHPRGPARLGPLHVTDNLLHPQTARLSQCYLSQNKRQEITEEVCRSGETQCHYGTVKELALWCSATERTFQNSSAKAGNRRTSSKSGEHWLIMRRSLQILDGKSFQTVLRNWSEFTVISG